MMLISVLAALTASLGWAGGAVLAQRPASILGAFEFTRIQLIACSAILCVICSVLGLWASLEWQWWPLFLVSSIVGILLGNLAMIECLRRGGARRTELLLALRAPLIGLMAYIWLEEIPSITDLIGAFVTLSGVALTILCGNNARSEKTIAGRSLTIVISLGLIATSFQGFGFLVMKPVLLSGAEPLAISAIRLSLAAFVLSTVALWPNNLFRPNSQMSPSLLGQTILPGFIGYGVSSSLLLYAIANFDAGIAAALGSISPILVLPILWIKERYSPNREVIIGAFLAVLGTAIIVVF